MWYLYVCFKYSVIFLLRIKTFIISFVKGCLVPKVKRETLALALQEKMVSPAPQVGKPNI